jgi:DNA-binding MarR family transcriptional regulator
MDAVQLFLDLSASNRESPIREALAREESLWFQQALDYRDIKIVQNDIADATQLTQSKVSRVLSRTTERI